MRNAQRNFPTGVAAKLGGYVYCLRDPRNRCVFYVGQGQNDRIFNHFDEADQVRSGKRNPTRKTQWIADIWGSGKDVDWFIVSQGLNTHEMDIVESAVYDSLSRSCCRDVLLNEASPPKSTFIGEKAIARMAAPAACLNVSMQGILLFPIHKRVSTGTLAYNACRCCWILGQVVRENAQYAVGVENGLSTVAFSINKWTSQPPKKWALDGPQNVPILVGLDWSHIVNGLGFWKRGRPIGVDFDGKGKYQVWYGDRIQAWQPC